MWIHQVANMHIHNMYIQNAQFASASGYNDRSFLASENAMSSSSSTEASGKEEASRTNGQDAE